MPQDNVENQANPQAEESELTRKDPNIEENTSSLFENGRAIYPLTSRGDDWWLITMVVISILTIIGYVVEFIVHYDKYTH